MSVKSLSEEVLSDEYAHRLKSIPHKYRMTKPFVMLCEAIKKHCPEDKFIPVKAFGNQLFKNKNGLMLRVSIPQYGTNVVELLQPTVSSHLTVEPSTDVDAVVALMQTLCVMTSRTPDTITAKEAAHSILRQQGSFTKRFGITMDFVDFPELRAVIATFRKDGKTHKAFIPNKNSDELLQNVLGVETLSYSISSTEKLITLETYEKKTK